MVIIGPTAVGKTAISIKLAKAFNAEIINGDSVQVYKRLDVGSAKITKEEMEGITHHLFDIKNPDEDFSVAEFQTLVREKITEISNRGKLPMIVGGTGLYINAVLYDFHFEEEGRKGDFAQKYLHLTNEELHELLNKVDPESAITIHPNNRRRVLRALEIFETSDTTKSKLLEKQKKEPLYDTYILGLELPRDVLYERINKRVDIMLKMGLLKEVESLYQDGINVNAIGYREFSDYFNGHLSIDGVIEEIKKNTRHYAKRQLTYFKNKLPVQWVTVNLANIEETYEVIMSDVILWLKQK